MGTGGNGAAAAGGGAEASGASSAGGGPDGGVVGALKAAEHAETLRRFVDEWCGTARAVRDATSGEEWAASTVEQGVAERDPVAARLRPTERRGAADLATTGNPQFDRLAAALAYACAEVARLRTAATDRLVPALLVFGERPAGEDAPPEGATQLALARAFPLLHDLVGFGDQLRATAENLLAQLAALAGGKQRMYAPLQRVRLVTVFRALGDALALMRLVDETVAANPALRGAFGQFKRMLQAFRDGAAASEVAAAGPAAIPTLQDAVNTLEARLCGGTGDLQRFLNGVASMPPPGQRFLDELAGTAGSALAETAGRVGLASERPGDRGELFAAVCLAVLHARLVGTGTQDKKLLRAVWDLHKRAAVVPLAGNQCLRMGEFLSSVLPQAAASLGPSEPLKADAKWRASALEDAQGGFGRDLATLMVHANGWLARADSQLPAHVSTGAALGARLRLLVQGLYIATRLRNMLHGSVWLHLANDAPLSTSRMRAFCTCAETLKALEAMYFRRGLGTGTAGPHVVRFTQGALVKLVAGSRASVDDVITSRRKSVFSSMQKAEAEAFRLDALAACKLGEDALDGPPTPTRLKMLQLALDTLRDSAVLKEESYVDAVELLHLLELAADLPRTVCAACDVSFLYFSRELTKARFADIYSRPAEAHRLHLAVAVFRDGERLLAAGDAPQDVLSAYSAELMSVLEEHVIMPLCRDVETDLRLHVHSARIAGVVDINPAQTGVRDLARFLRVGRLELTSQRIDLAARVRDHLNAGFHNHTAIALHNWKTYGEMRNLAREKYSLDLAEIQLPSQTLEQGLDVLEIMRNIHLFVARYHYNLATQTFVERGASAKDRKHLNTVSIRHAANSIRTHGTGIMNTMINFVFQFLRRKLQILSQFLYDDHIRSRLMRELRAFNELKAAAARAEFPFDRAVKFARDIKKLGVTEDNQSFLDQFRVLIAEVGNALGFVRMVRLGGMHYSNNAAKFVPDLARTGDVCFAEAAREEGLSAAAVDAAKVLDETLQNLRDGSGEGVDYFQVLVSVFQSELRSEKNAHLEEFYLILPALSASHVDAMLAAKEKLSKRGKDSTNAAFTDDGLSLGVAFLLRVLGQDVAFDSMHWFDSASRHFTEADASLAAEARRLGGGGDRASVSGSVSSRPAGLLKTLSRARSSTSAPTPSGTSALDEAHSMELKRSRLKLHAEEFLLLKFSLVGARTFFRE